MPDYLIRTITEQDAADFNAYRRRITNEPHNTVALSAGEYKRTVEEEQERILSALQNPDQRILVAEVQGKIIGSCQCRGSASPPLRHAVSLGIDVDKAYRHQGIGSALMREMLNWARSHPIICRVELEVFVHNHAALAMYRRFGFVIEGTKKRAYFKYGQFIDAHLMALIFDK